MLVTKVRYKSPTFTIIHKGRYFSPTFVTTPARQVRYFSPRYASGVRYFSPTFFAGPSITAAADDVASTSTSTGSKSAGAVDTAAGRADRTTPISGSEGSAPAPGSASSS